MRLIVIFPQLDMLTGDLYCNSCCNLCSTAGAVATKLTPDPASKKVIITITSIVSELS